MRAGLLALTLVAAGCASGPPPDDAPPRKADEGARWADRVERLGEAWVVTGSTPVDGSPAAARDRLVEALLTRAADAAVADALGPDARPDPAGLREAHRARKDWLSGAVLEEGTHGERLGARLRAEVKADRLRQALETAGLLATTRAQVIVVLRQGEAEGAAEVAKAHEADLSESISAELAARGYVPRSWRDVKAELAKAAVPGGSGEAELASAFVAGDWKADDPRYQLPLVLLRARGRFLAGFRIIELTRTRTELRPPGEAAPIPVDSVSLTLRGDLHDLLHGVSLEVATRTRNAAITPGRTEAATRQQLVVDLAKELARALSDSLGRTLERERRLRDRTYTVVFDGYEREEQERIEWLLAQVVAEDVGARRDGRRLVATLRTARDAIPLREELRRSLGALRLEPSAVDRDGDTLTFRR